MKKTARLIITSILGWQVRRLKKKNSFKIIGIAGSIGKTSTKIAVASVLKQGYRVRFQDGNYNHIVSVPLIFFGRSLPSLFNPLGWLKVFILNEIDLRRPYSYEYILVELGTDGPGQIAEFKRYLSLDIAVLTAIAPEHMEFFKDIDAVAGEELSIVGLGGRLFVNTDLCNAKYLKNMPPDMITYGTSASADYRASINKNEITVSKSKEDILNFGTDLVSKAQIYSFCAAASIGIELGLSRLKVEKGLSTVEPVAGRMQKLNGIKGSLIIDDTYNASPEAVKEALDSLYKIGSGKKIALLGSMNELGSFSAQAHEDIGGYCDAKKLELVITIGHDANKYLAPAARKQGCQVKSFEDPYEAGEYLKDIAGPDSIVLAKGSQNGVFAEEAIKQILENPADISKLVRQNRHWLKIKNKQFSPGEKI